MYDSYAIIVLEIILFGFLRYIFLLGLYLTVSVCLEVRHQSIALLTINTSVSLTSFPTSLVFCFTMRSIVEFYPSYGSSYVFLTDDYIIIMSCLFSLPPFEVNYTCILGSTSSLLIFPSIGLSLA